MSAENKEGADKSGCICDDGFGMNLSCPVHKGKEPPSEHVESPRQNELLPCPFCGAEKATLLLPTCRPETPYNPLDRLYPAVRCSGCYAEATGSNEDYKGGSAIARWNKRAPLSDDVKAVKKEGDPGLKEASEHSAHVLQNALCVLCNHPESEHKDFPGYQRHLFSPKRVGAAPVTPKSEEELENEAPLAPDQSTIPTQNALLGWLKPQCSRLLYGECSTRRCLARGGALDDGGKVIDYDKATCEPYELSVLLGGGSDGSFSPKSASMSSPAGSSTEGEGT